MKKKVIGEIKLQILAGKANPSPPVGPALGQKGVNIGAFCKEFNDKTASLEGPIPVIITVYVDKSYSFVLKNPPVSFLLKKHAGLKSGAKLPGREVVGKVSKAQVLEIAKLKLGDMGVDSLVSAVSMVEGTARSMSIQVIY